MARKYIPDTKEYGTAAIINTMVQYGINNAKLHEQRYPIFMEFYSKRSDTPTAKARLILNYTNFQIYSKAYKTDLFH